MHRLTRPTKTTLALCLNYQRFRKLFESQHRVELRNRAITFFDTKTKAYICLYTVIKIIRVLRHPDCHA